MVRDSLTLFGSDASWVSGCVEGVNVQCELCRLKGRECCGESVYVALVDDHQCRDTFLLWWRFGKGVALSPARHVVGVDGLGEFTPCLDCFDARGAGGLVFVF